MMRFLILAILLLCGLPVQAQATVDGGLLGMDETALKQLFPDMRRLTKPVLGPRHMRGNWRLEHTPLANLSLNTTFFFRSRQLVRIEQQAVLNQPVCPASMSGEAWFADLQTRYGTGLTANNTDAGGQRQQSTIWVNQAADVALYLTQQTEQCGVLVVYQPHTEKDASEL
jgi:hypothetical protein